MVRWNLLESCCGMAQVWRSPSFPSVDSYKYFFDSWLNWKAIIWHTYKNEILWLRLVCYSDNRMWILCLYSVWYTDDPRCILRLCSVVILVLICTFCFTCSVHFSYWLPFLRGLCFMPAGSTCNLRTSSCFWRAPLLRSHFWYTMLIFCWYFRYYVFWVWRVPSPVFWFYVFVLEVCGYVVSMGPIS